MRKIQKAKSLKADCICLDMEDGVSATAKVFFLYINYCTSNINVTGLPLLLEVEAMYFL